MKRWLLILLLLFICPVVQAGSLTIVPDSVYFENVIVGGYSQEEVSIIADYDKEVRVEYEFQGPIKDWFSVNIQENIVISKNAPYTFLIDVNPPKNASVGVHTGYLMLTFLLQQNSVTSAIPSTSIIEINVDITRDEITDVEVGNIIIDDILAGEPLLVQAEINNKGNIFVTPSIFIRILDQEKNNLLIESQINDVTIHPYSSDVLSYKYNPDLSVGQYWAEVVVMIDEMMVRKELKTFDVLNPGSPVIKGELIHLWGDAQKRVGEFVNIEALFKNNGEEAVDARLVGVVEYEGSVYDRFEISAGEIGSGEEKILKSSFKPEREGPYKVSGYVVYSGKTTLTKSSITEVINISNAELVKPIQLSLDTISLLFLGIFAVISIVIIVKKKFFSGKDF